MVGDSDVVADKGHVVWSSGLSDQRKPSLFRLATPLAGVAGSAGGNEVLPTRWAVVRLRYDMVDGHLSIADTAILTLVVIAAQDVALGQHHAAAWGPDVAFESDYAGDRESFTYRPHTAVTEFDTARFAAKHKTEGAPHRTHVERLVILVENEYGLVENGCRPRGLNGLRWRVLWNGPDHGDPEN